MNGRVELITQSEYARRRGVAKSAVARAVREGRITLINGRVDQAVADIQWAKNTRARADSGRSTALAATAGATPALLPENAATAPDLPAGVQADDDYQSLRVRRERAQLETAERENAKAAGQLVEREAVERGTFDTFRALRDAIMSTPVRAAAKAVGLADTRDIERVFTAELRQAFDDAEARLMQHLGAQP